MGVLQPLLILLSPTILVHKFNKVSMANQAFPICTLKQDNVQRCGFASIQDRGSHPVPFTGEELQHKSLVELVFLTYNRVSSAEMRLTLIQVATSVTDSLGDNSALDAVQPMPTVW